MNDKNYELFRRNRVEIFNMFYDAWENAPICPFFPTEDEMKQYEKELEEFKEQVRQEVYIKLCDMGFQLKSIE